MVFKKAPFGPSFHQSRRNKRSAPNDPGDPSRDPAFHETIEITVPFGPNVFFKLTFFDKDWLIDLFCRLFFVLCFVDHLYHTYS